MRLFLGIPLAPAVVEELAQAIQPLRVHGEKLRWSSPDSWHITLQFLGNTNPQQFTCLVARLRDLQFLPVPVALVELGFFDRAGIFFAGVHPAPDLLALQKRIASSTAACGFVAEARPFHPHITLARAKGDGRGQYLRALQARINHQPQFTSFLAPEFLLYEAFLEPAGSRYEIRERFPLARP
jgi:2'-5' RNA ligase